MADNGAPFRITDHDAVSVSLSDGERAALRELVAGYRELLRGESQASDPAIARLFPPAYPEDPLRNFDFDRGAHDGLMDQRLAAIDEVEQHTDAEVLSPERSRSWLGVLNDLRLIMGARLNITEDTDETTFRGDPAAAEAFGMYRWLTYLVGILLEALDPTLEDLGADGPPPEPKTG
jgi:hypothetical protein